MIDKKPAPAAAPDPRPQRMRFTACARCGAMVLADQSLPEGCPRCPVQIEMLLIDKDRTAITRTAFDATIDELLAAPPREFDVMTALHKLAPLRLQRVR
jgi:hypothetical protein